MIYPQTYNNFTEAHQQHTGNRVYMEDGEVKLDVITDTMSIEEAKRLTLEAIELEYSLPCDT